VPPLAGAGPWETWIYRALAMLVVACPCALVISTPVTIVSGLTGAARAGILIKGGRHLENLGRIQALMIDKTGTLTLGEPRVVHLEPVDGTTADELLTHAAAVERHSEHPLARAVLDRARERGLVTPMSSDFEALPGRGARATIHGSIFQADTFAGNARLAGELGVISPEIEAAVAAGDAAGQTTILIIERSQRGARMLGTIVLADEPRAEARAAIADLHAVGVRRIIMLTGDNRGAADAVAHAVGLDEVHAELLPDDKVRHVRELEAAGTRVAFIGDGVNDAPALAAATVGIAMGAAGTDVALETADVALMGDDLRLAAAAVRRSRRTLGIIKQNIAFSLAVKAVFLVLAVSGLATLWMAVAADMGGSLLVVGNGLRARYAGRSRP
jgi:Cd2+/Zn2+-exporting ATPase